MQNGGTQGLSNFNLPGPNDRARGLTAEMSPWLVSESRFRISRISSHRVERARDHWVALDTTQKHSLAGIYFIDDVPGRFARLTNGPASGARDAPGSGGGGLVIIQLLMYTELVANVTRQRRREGVHGQQLERLFQF